MNIKLFEAPSEFPEAAPVEARKMDVGGVTGGYELPENLQELIGYGPQNTTTPITVDASTPVTVDETGLNFTPAQRARMAEDLYVPYIEGMPTTEGAAEFLYGFDDPYVDPRQDTTN